jgi:hypothetical protein
MSLSGTSRLAVTFMLVGAAAMLVLVAGGWAAYHYLAASPEPVVAAAPAVAAPAPVVPVPVVEAPKPVAVVAKVEPPEAAKPEPAAKEEPAKKPEEAKPTDEEKERAFQAEVAFMERRFDEHKAMYMNMIDAYLALPADQRLDYLRKVGEDLRQQIENERQLEGLPARAGDQRRAMGEMLRMFRERGTEDEKKKVSTFMGDMVQQQMARFQAEMQKQINGPAGAAPQP